MDYDTNIIRTIPPLVRERFCLHIICFEEVFCSHGRSGEIEKKVRKYLSTCVNQHVKMNPRGKKVRTNYAFTNS